MLNNKTAMKIISLLAAICLWMYVVGEVDPETKGKVGDVPVYFTGAEVLAENGLAAVNEEEITVSVVLKGKRSDVNDIKKSGLAAYVDVSDCEEGKNTRDIEITVPENVSLENVSAETLTFAVEKLDKQKKPVEIEFYGNSGSSELTPFIIESTPEEITVSGAESSVNKIRALKGKIALEDISADKSSWVTVEVDPVNKNGNEIGGVQLNKTKVKVKVQLLQLKTVRLQVNKENLDDSIVVEKISLPENIALAGPESVMKEIDKIEGIVDMQGMSESGSLPIQLELPESVYVYDKENVPTAEITIKAEE